MSDEFDLGYRIKRKEKKARVWESETSSASMLRLPLAERNGAAVARVPREQQPEHLFPRQLYAGNLPAFVDEEDLRAFLFACMQSSGGLLERDNPILAAEHNPDRHFVLLELRSFEETTSLLQLKGVVYV